MLYKTSSKNGIKFYQHREIVETAIGEKLPTDSVIHHIDGNPFNNSHNNLLVCPDQAYHMLIHARTSAVQRGQNPNTEGYCVVCETIKFKDQFPARADAWNDVDSRCKICQNTYKKTSGFNLRKNRPNNWRDNLMQQYRRLKRSNKRPVSWL